MNQFQINVALCLVLGLLSANATPVRNELATVDELQPDETSTFTDRIFELQLRLENVTHYTDAWLRRQRNRADSLVSVINGFTLDTFAHSAQLVDTMRQQTENTLRHDCSALSPAERDQRREWVHSNGTAMGDVVANCAALIHDDLTRMANTQFYDYYRDLQTQSLSAKRTIYLAFHVYNAVTQQENMLWLLDEIVEQTDRSFEVYMRPEIEQKFELLIENGKLIVNMAQTCAFDVATYYSELVHRTVDQC